MKNNKSYFKIGLLFIGILFFQTLFSRENYLPGYVINLKGDTLHGLVNYRNWANNPSKVRFKSGDDNNSKVYKPNDILEFRVANEIYVSGIVTSETSENMTNRLQQDSTLFFTVDTTFLQTIFQGKKSLYYFKNVVGNDNYYIRQNGKYELLIHKRYLKNKDDKNILLENKDYLKQLAGYMNDCPSVRTKLVSTEYNLQGLKKLYQYYYTCSASHPSFQKKQENAITEFGFVAGATFSTLHFEGEGYEYLTDIDFSKSTNFTAGLTFNVILPRNQRRWSIMNELLVSSYKANGYYHVYTDQNYYYNMTINIGLTYLKMNNLLRFNYQIGSIHLFMNAGISNGIILSATNYKKKVMKNYSVENTFESEAIKISRKIEQGFILGSGIKYKKLSFEFRNENGNGMSMLWNLKSKANRKFLLLGYTL